MALKVQNLILSLASFIASTSTAAGGGDVVVDRNIFALQADESIAANAPYAVLIPYGGPAPEDLLVVEERSVQCMVYGKNAAACMDFSQRLFETLFEKDSEDEPHPRNTFDLPAKKYDSSTPVSIIADDDVGNYDVHLLKTLQPPGLIGRDENGRNQVSFNFDVRFELPT